MLELEVETTGAVSPGIFVIGEWDAGDVAEVSQKFMPLVW